MTRRKEEDMTGQEVVLEEPDSERPAEVENLPEANAPVQVDDVLSPSEYVEMYHPDVPTGSNGEPHYSTTSRAAFDQVWRDKGWCLREDPYARPAGEPEPGPVAIENVPPAQGDEPVPLPDPEQ